MLDRLQREEEERDPMKELEAKTHDAKTEMAVADALDEIRTRNARLQRAEGLERSETSIEDQKDEERKRQDREDAEAARRAFERAGGMEEIILDAMEEDGNPPTAKSNGEPKVEEQMKLPELKSTMPPPNFSRTVKKKKDFGAALGIKKKPSLV